MAKDKKKGKLPKRVAGIKLPKDLRHKGEALIAQAASPAGREAIARGLTIAATFANVAVRKTRAAAPATPEPVVAPGETTPTPPPPIDAQKLAEAVNTVADAVLGRLFGGKKGA